MRVDHPEKALDHVNVQLANIPYKRYRISFFQAVGLTWLLVLTPLAGAVAQTGSVEGTVVNARTGEPVPEARVMIEGTRWFGLADRQGRYSILDVPIGLYNIRVEAVGYRISVSLNHRILEHDRRVQQVEARRVDFELRPFLLSLERPVVPPAPPIAVRPGFGLGVSLGMQGLAGNANRSVGSGRSTDLYIRYGTSFGFFLHAGGRFGKLDIDSVSQDLGVTGFYIEPRFVLLNVSSRWAPFFAGQISFNWETLQTARAQFTSPGHVLGGGVGAIFRLSSQVVLEGGLSVGVTSHADFLFRGDYVSYQCMEEVEHGTPLPESAVRCGDVSSPLPVYTCYAPFHESLGGSCDLPRIRRGDSERSGLWYRLKVGIQFELAGLQGS